jgi:hypothetical protein
MKISMIYYDSDMSIEIIQSIFDDNCDDFQHVNFIFSQKITSLFWGLFNDQFELRVRYRNTKNIKMGGSRIEKNGLVLS